MRVENTTVLIIGAGPAGSVAAGILKQHDIPTIVVEKEKFPRFVIGESLLPRCMEAFQEAGFMDDLEQQGFQEKNGAFFIRDHDICDFSFETQFTKGWNKTWQMQRARFDKCLTDNLEKRGVDLRFQHTVQSITFEGSDSTTTIINEEGEEFQIKARFIMDASGYGRVIPRLFQLDRPSELPPRKTLLVHLKDPNRQQYQQPDRIHVIVQQLQTWIWLIPFSDGTTSVGFVSNPDYFEGLHGSTEEQMRTLIEREPMIRERFADVEFLFEPRFLSGWSVTTEKFYGDGYVLTGNVTEFLDPVFSSGVTLAAVSSSLAANLVVKMMNGGEVDWDMDYMVPMEEGVDVFRTYVNAWYNGDLQKIFFSNRIEESIKAQICSVLAGYVWDYSNPFVRKHKERVEGLAQMIE
ncbi:MAG: tryptophan 7-halogenase [Saprospiraceae bacterium]|jgi:flavin-dependent dehydrogenase|nr:tryptophan 7-halogenase [Saprospiraceae bacterium]MCA0334715.1 tryptophan 7-halogenase [Bacteroidota bacterium]MCB0603944.1 tryptophan 7-halogenase [Saprospiraceae bacterium]HQU95006.1 NAD(P)/FAD-dependent oxidoreductase [Saprospiraceae bacterium]HQW94671.1 NAD(P)/FAD-dependent oxidoreductase [Saprospiraceae bacterium]